MLKIKLKEIPKYYNSFALILLNTLIFLILLNILIFIIFNIMKRFDDGKNGNQPIPAAFETVYPQLKNIQIKELLDETWNRPFVYEAYTQFKDPPFNGKYVNINPAGFRNSKNQGVWPPNPDCFNIFIFGSSQVFGYGISDDQTISSFLQDILSDQMNRCVKTYNFGRGFYYSSQETILFIRLLIKGYTPDLAIFIDGTGDFLFYDDEPMYTKNLEGFMKGINENQESASCNIFKKMPVYQLINNLRLKYNKKERDNTGFIEEDVVKTQFRKIHSEAIQSLAEKNLINNSDKANEIVKSALTLYIRNIKMIKTICDYNKIKVVFVWQPIPTYNYDLNFHLFKDFVGCYQIMKPGYDVMKNYLSKNPIRELLWLADIQKDIKAPLYVDHVHYSGEMCNLIASKISDYLIQNNSK
jgi:hypothetical protein